MVRPDIFAVTPFQLVTLKKKAITQEQDTVNTVNNVTVDNKEGKVKKDAFHEKSPLNKI